jgi:hypothetical protein
MAHDVFISYSSHDKVVADAACATLEAAGVRCWIAPRDVGPGMEWGASIIRAIEQCRVMVLIFSKNANQSPPIRKEVERAVSKGRSIITMRIEDIAPDPSLEFFISNLHWLDALTPPLAKHLKRLVETVSSLLGVPAAMPASVVNKKTTGIMTTGVPKSLMRRPAIRWAMIGCVAVIGVVIAYEIAVAPRTADDYYWRGMPEKDWHPDEAIADFTQAIALDPGNAKSYWHRGQAYSNKNLHDQAIYDFTKAIALDPDNYFAYQDRGDEYEKMNLRDQAIADFRKMLNLEPSSYAIQELGRLCAAPLCTSERFCSQSLDAGPVTSEVFNCSR